jgi:hypothetical protein
MFVSGASHKMLYVGPLFSYYILIARGEAGDNREQFEPTLLPPPCWPTAR